MDSELGNAIEVIRNAVIALVAIGTYEHGKKVVNQWLRQKRGEDKYELGKKMAHEVYKIQDEIVRSREYGSWLNDEDILTKFEEMAQEDPRVRSSENRYYAFTNLLLLRTRDRISNLKVMNLEAKIFEMDFSSEIEIIFSIVRDLQYALEDMWSDYRSDEGKAARILLTGVPDDDLGKNLQKAVISITDGIRKELLVQGIAD